LRQQAEHLRHQSGRHASGRLVAAAEQLGKRPRLPAPRRVQHDLARAYRLLAAAPLRHEQKRDDAGVRRAARGKPDRQTLTFRRHGIGCHPVEEVRLFRPAQRRVAVKRRQRCRREMRAA